MASISKEQLVKYIKGLEKKVKDYQSKLQDRDTEINALRKKLTNVVDDPELYNKALLSTQIGPEPDSVDSPEQEKKVQFTPPAKMVQPLQKRSATFVKKAAPGTDQAIKDSIRMKKEESSLPRQDATPIEQTEPLPQPEVKEEISMPSVNFEAGEFLTKVLEGEEEADEMKALLERLEKAEPNDKRGIYLSMTKLYWRMVQSMGKRMTHENLPWEKRLFLRYGMLDDKLMGDRNDIWSQLYLDKSKPENTGMYFLDEWLDDIARGNIKYSTIDEMALDGAKPDQNATGETALKYELININQMQRMCVGPRANEITILLQEYCSPSRENPVVNRTWLQEGLQEILKCDYTMFNRKHKGEEKVVKPLFIICPGYGQKAGCWEPWSPGKKGDSGPRICISAFPPRSSMKALLMGVAEYRWEYAKADAMHYWLSEGLTGKWLALFNKKEQRKDLKEVFIDSYYHWVANEARRIPKLEKRFRDFFWLNAPFGDEVKERLKGGGLFGRLIELEEAKKKRDEEERIEIERIKAEREAKKQARKANMDF
jgi:hypothetical protein